MIRRINRFNDHLLMLHSVLISQEVWSSSIPIRVMGWMKRINKKFSANLMKYDLKKTPAFYHLTQTGFEFLLAYRGLCEISFCC